MSARGRKTAAIVAGVLFVVLLVLLVLFTPEHAGWASKDFLQGFWANFWSDLFVAIPIAGGLAWLVNWRKMPAVEVRAATDLFTGNAGHLVVTFYLVNTGFVALRSDEIYWIVTWLGPQHLDVPQYHENSGVLKDDSSFLIKNPGSSEATMTQNLRGKLNTPLFHDLDVTLFSVEVPTELVQKYKFKYYLSTPYGILPPGVRAKDGRGVDFDKLPLIKVKSGLK